MGELFKLLWETIGRPLTTWLREVVVALVPPDPPPSVAGAMEAIDAAFWERIRLAQELKRRPSRAILGLIFIAPERLSHARDLHHGWADVDLTGVCNAIKFKSLLAERRAEWKRRREETDADEERANADRTWDAQLLNRLIRSYTEHSADARYRDDVVGAVIVSYLSSFYREVQHAKHPRLHRFFLQEIAEFKLRLSIARLIERKDLQRYRKAIEEGIRVGSLGTEPSRPGARPSDVEVPSDRVENGKSEQRVDKSVKAAPLIAPRREAAASSSDSETSAWYATITDQDARGDETRSAAVSAEASDTGGLGWSAGSSEKQSPDTSDERIPPIDDAPERADKDAGLGWASDDR